MNQNFNKKLRFFILYIALPLALAKLLWSGALIFLDKAPNISTKSSNEYNYHYSTNLASKFIGDKADIPKEVAKEDDGQKLDNIKLKGTYQGGDASFIVIEDGSESKFIYIGDKFRGYKLSSVGDRKVIFKKGGKNYYVLLEDESKPSSSPTSSSAMPPPPDMDAPADNGAPVSITRNEMHDYIKNPDKIWNNIRIQEMRKNGQLDGFRVNYVKHGSFFDKAGLKSGDVIKAIDGSEIKSLGDVMKYYTNVDSLDSLSLTVLRGGSEIELDFNVN